MNPTTSIYSFSTMTESYLILRPICMAVKSEETYKAAERLVNAFVSQYEDIWAITTRNYVLYNEYKDQLKEILRNQAFKHNL